MMNTLTQLYYDRRASNLLLLSMVLGQLVSTLAEEGYRNIPAYRQPLVLTTFCVLIALATGMAWLVRKGKMWAKIGWVVAVLLRFIYQAIFIKKNGISALVPLIGLTYLATLFLHLVALFYAFRFKFVKRQPLESL
ncbi:hypothetical protein [Hymenobacter lapidiphilus]|uniref:Uncharacterized protein n=1 Tax=Hymenobacter lapidiphilus TaxID=2608003 RepID=A0A7Y7U7I7_9BACT|nr:hypothetical protein [Hymenobacter lapidiphilus]NVO32879.1 hypothetical protein [Hymenobacter lapidiphilus]